VSFQRDSLLVGSKDSAVFEGQEFAFVAGRISSVEKALLGTTFVGGVAIFVLQLE
jgi:hypothetical protein